MSNLLIVDWDYFFPNPMEAQQEGRKDILLYDWGHKEAPYFMDGVWGSRAQGFLMNGLELPPVDIDAVASFWGRFKTTPRVKVFYGDSNARAVSPVITGKTRRWDHVYLYDAHHDAGYRSEPTAYQLVTKGQWSCENWMVLYWAMGASLHVRYPKWRASAMEIEPEPLVPVDRQVDDGSQPPVAFDYIYICRSSAWVPPWRDGDGRFERFVYRAPGDGAITCLEDGGMLLWRTFDEAQEQANAEQMKAMMTQPEAQPA